jgi:hypothetical protein
MVGAHIPSMNLRDWITETEGFEGTLFDPRTMARLKCECEVGLWFWWASSDWQAVLYRDPAYFKWKAGPFLTTQNSRPHC